MRRKVISGIRPSFPGLSQSQGQVTHVLLTRSPLEHPKRAFPHDLHVLSTPPAFVLSQDQTLQQGTHKQPPPTHNGEQPPAKPNREKNPNQAPPPQQTKQGHQKNKPKEPKPQTPKK